MGGDRLMGRFKSQEAKALHRAIRVLPGLAQPDDDPASLIADGILLGIEVALRHPEWAAAMAVIEDEASDDAFGVSRHEAHDLIAELIVTAVPIERS